jgi:hypothetical protein
MLGFFNAARVCTIEVDRLLPEDFRALKRPQVMHRT